jgi:hypothetical protein
MGGSFGSASDDARQSLIVCRRHVEWLQVAGHHVVYSGGAKPAECLGAGIRVAELRAP